ncbi:LamG-like jellyroll fold domain-containing protein [Kribbella sp. NPDC003557]|uniref:LamG-like jellyroll fold domain-containing protein n=1 Tax=Kribbella sp. NPDC003557 TaxID=3154449 RepID=UPI0033BF1538
MAWLVAGPAEARPATVAAAGGATKDSPSQQATATGERVEVLQKRTETSQVFANPDGTYTLEQSNVPVRAKRGDQWFAIDTTLEHSGDGRIRPKATALDLSLSGGGTDPLIVVKSDGHELKLSWPGALPAPTIAEDSVTYANVFPDVDLKISASADSYNEVLVVKTPAAARLPELQDLDLEIEAGDLTVAKAPGGVIEAKDDLGQVVFTGPQPMMWDSRGEAQAPTDDDRTEAPLEGDKVVQVPVSVTQDTLSISPAASLINDAATEYPLHIDPALSSTQSGRAMMNEHYPSTSSWNWVGPEGVGYQSFEPWSRKRLIYKMGISGLAGTHILAAEFKAYETWAASCTKKEVQVWKTAAINTEVNWSNGSGSNVWLKKVASVTDAVGRDECTPNGKWLEFNVLSAVAEQAAARSSWVHLGLRAASETDSMAWKRFRSDGFLSITYNRIPVLANPHTTDPAMGCPSSSNPGRINQLSPVPWITVLDADRTSTQVGFEFWINNKPEPAFTGVSAVKLSGSTVEFSPQADVTNLYQGVLIGWRARAWDGVDYSAWSPMCWFVIDTTKPPVPEVEITSGNVVYSLGQRIDVHIKATSADQNYFRYTIDTLDPTSANLPVSPGTFSFTAAKPGPAVIRAWAYDRTGNRSADYGQAIVKIRTGDPAGLWHMDEGAGTILLDVGAAGRNATMSATAGWAAGDRFDPTSEQKDWSVDLPGNGFASPTQNDILDTTRSFSASVRVKLSNKPGRQIAISEDRTGTSGFTLGVLSQNLADPGEPKATWAFTMADPDGSGEITAVSEELPYLAGEWVYLTGVYDSTNQTMALYVNDETYVKAGLPFTMLDGDGALRLGTGMSGGTSLPVQGQIDDARIYPGPIDESTVLTDMADSSPTS